MSSLPGEVLRDVLQPLDRWTLDDVQFTDHRFLQLIMLHMSDVCLRQIHFADFNASNESGTSYTQMDGELDREISCSHEDTASVFTEFLQALRSSRVKFLFFNGLVFTPENMALVLQVPIAIDALSLQHGNCAELTPSQFQEVLLHFSPNLLDIDGACRLRACQVTDGLIRALSENRVRRMKFQNPMPVDGDSFPVTDDAIVDFCVQEDVPIDKKGDTWDTKPVGELVVCNGRFTKDLFKRLVEASTVSKRTRSLRIVVSPSLVEAEVLRDFAQHLKYRDRGRLRIYDFPDDQQGAVDPMHLQIVLHPDNKLELIRAQRWSPLFPYSY